MDIDDSDHGVKRQEYKENRGKETTRNVNETESEGKLLINNTARVSSCPGEKQLQGD
jgi:hypothetical protein